MPDELLNVSAIFLPIIITVLSIWLSIRQGKGQSFKGLLGVIIALGLLSGCVIYWQQQRADGKHARETACLNQKLEKTQKKLDEARLDEAKQSSFLSGQISSLNQVVTAFAQKNFNLEPVAEAVHDLVKNEFRDATNEELKSQVADLARRLREFDANCREDQNKLYSAPFATDNYLRRENLSNQQRIQFEPLRTEAAALRHQLLKRITNPPQDTFAESTIEVGGLAGPDPAAQVAKYLELIASLLPTGRSNNSAASDKVSKR